MVLISIRSSKPVCRLYVCICKHESKISCEKRLSSDPPLQPDHLDTIVSLEPTLVCEWVAVKYPDDKASKWASPPSIPRLTPSLCPLCPISGATQDACEWKKQGRSRRGKRDLIWPLTSLCDWLKKGDSTQTHTQTLTVSRGSCSRNIFLFGAVCSCYKCWMSESSCRSFTGNTNEKAGLCKITWCQMSIYQEHFMIRQPILPRVQHDNSWTAFENGLHTSIFVPECL